MTQTVHENVFDDEPMPEEPRRSPGRLGRPKREREPSLVSPEMAAALVAKAREEGIEVAGNSGLLSQLMKSVLEAALAEELTDHLGYEPGIRPVAGRGTLATAAPRRRC